MKKRVIYSLISTILMLMGCSDVNNERIPVASVRIEVSLAQQQKAEYWADDPTSYVIFLKPSIPYGFPYSISSTTGFAGVLQVCGFESGLYAFDLACPIECSPEVKIMVDENALNARCPVCGSTYDIFYGSGAPIAGPAASGENKFALRKYQINQIATTGSYIITN